MATWTATKPIFAGFAGTLALLAFERWKIILASLFLRPVVEGTFAGFADFEAEMLHGFADEVKGAGDDDAIGVFGFFQCCCQ